MSRGAENVDIFPHLFMEYEQLIEQVVPVRISTLVQSINNGKNPAIITNQPPEQRLELVNGWSSLLIPMALVDLSDGVWYTRLLLKKLSNKAREHLMQCLFVLTIEFAIYVYHDHIRIAFKTQP